VNREACARCEGNQCECGPRGDTSAAYPPPSDAGELEQLRHAVATLSAERNQFSDRFQAAVGKLSDHEFALKADAERLAELCQQRDGITASLRKAGKRYERGRIDWLIAVYEECAARGRTFGGGG